MWSVGRNPTTEALRSNWQISEVLLQKAINVDQKIDEIITSAHQKKIKITYVEKHFLDKLSKGEPHQGVAAKLSWEIQELTPAILEDREGLYIYIREAQYEQNLGAIIRTAEVAGARGVIIPPKQEITDVAARISMGAVFHLPIYSYSLFPCINLFKKEAYGVYGIERGGENVFKADMPENLLLIIGGEDYALSEEVTEKCDLTVSIPQFGKINSLNMSVAAGIAIFAYVAKIK
jgi:23S rRNA (guanosine2251-2'-O)-methyltransferase